MRLRQRHAPAGRAGNRPARLCSPAVTRRARLKRRSSRERPARLPSLAPMPLPPGQTWQRRGPRLLRCGSRPRPAQNGRAGRAEPGQGAASAHPAAAVNNQCSRQGRLPAGAVPSGAVAALGKARAPFPAGRSRPKARGPPSPPAAVLARASAGGTQAPTGLPAPAVTPPLRPGPAGARSGVKRRRRGNLGRGVSQERPSNCSGDEMG